jgi:1,4-dihydroxy-2-naphthoyl-CoA hydrolase
MGQWEPSGFVKLMQVKVLKRSGERSEAEIFVRDELCNRRGVMHGGAIMGWGDTMGGMTASAALADNQRTATIECKTNFFVPIPKGDTARAVCTPLHSGRTTIVLQTNITRGDGKLAAIITQTQIVLPAKERPTEPVRE